MKRIILLLGVIAIAANSWSQHGYLVAQGAHVKSVNGAYLVFGNSSLINRGTIEQGAGSGYVKFTGSSGANLSGTSTTIIDRLLLNKNFPATLSLESNIQIVTEVDFQGGLLNLGNSFIELGETGKLNGESELSRAYTTGSGYIQANRVLSSPASANIGNLGAIISSNANLGNVIIKRGHAVQTGIGAGGISIQRYYDITPAINRSLNATLRFHYFDAELNNLDEASLALWRSVPGSWTFLGSNQSSTSSNYVEKQNISSFARMTLAAGCPVITVSIPDVYAIPASRGGAANTIYTGYGPDSVTLSAVVSGSTGYTYRWTAGSAGGTPISTASSVLVKPSVTTTYYLSVSDQNGCSSETVTKTISVLNIGCDIGKFWVCAPQRGVYTSQCLTTRQINNLADNSFYLGQCSATAPAAVTKTEPVGIEMYHFVVNAYPNPSGNYFTLVLQSNRNYPASIKVMDLLGRVVEARSNLAKEFTITLGAHYRPGVYYVEVLQGNERRILKLVKQ